MPFRNFTSLAVDWYDQTDAYVTTVNITADVKSLPLFTDTGTGEVNSATVVVRSLDGNYNTTGSTIFAEFDRIRIRVTDLASNTYDRFFEIVNIIPSQTKGEGTLLTLECLGIEYHTQQVHMVKPYYFEDSFTLIKSIGDIYNANRGVEQPKLSKHDVVFLEGNGFGVALPFYNANNWEYGINEETIYNRFMDQVEGAGAAVSAGGALTFYELSMDSTGVNAIDMKLRESGDNSSIVLVENSVVKGVKIGEQEGMLSNPTGTNLIGWGSAEHGTLPVENSRYDSGILFFLFRPEWITAIDYRIDAKVKVTPTDTTAPKHYKALTNHTSSGGNKPPSSDWDQIDMGDEFGDTVNYSKWTDNAAVDWGNMGCDPKRTIFTTGGWYDINLVINDDSFFRTWVDARARTDAELDALAVTAGDGYSFDGTKNNFPRGFRILVDAGAGAPTGQLANFANMVVEEQPTNSVGGQTWRKLYNFAKASNQVQVAVRHEGKVYADTITGTDASPTHSWADISEATYGNDCFHPYSTLPTNVDGIDLVINQADGTRKTRSEITDSTERPDITKAGGQFGQNQESAIEFVSVASDVGTTAANGAGDELDPYYRNAIGFNITFPLPNNNFNGGNKVGHFYGGGAVAWVTSNSYVVGTKVHESGSFYNCIVDHTSGTFATDLAAERWLLLVGGEPATLDIQNQNYTHDGQQGFNTTIDPVLVTNETCEDYGQINAVAFWLKYSVVSLGVELNDEHKFRAWFIDTKDNVVYQDFVVRFSNNWEDIRLPISGFRIYRGRKPVYGFDAVIAAFFPPKELEVINIFEWRNIKMFGVQLQSQYDKFGRFNPNSQILDEAGNSVTWSNLLGSTRTLQMDGFRFIKPLLVTSGRDETRNLEPDFIQFPNITVYDQLKNAVLSQLEIEKFKHKEFTIESSGDEIFDVPFGDRFHLKNADLISESDGGANQIELVNKRSEFSITKPTGGKGGLRRKMNGSKIFT